MVTLEFFWFLLSCSAFWDCAVCVCDDIKITYALSLRSFAYKTDDNFKHLRWWCYFVRLTNLVSQRFVLNRSCFIWWRHFMRARVHDELSHNSYFVNEYRKSCYLLVSLFCRMIINSLLIGCVLTVSSPWWAPRHSFFVELVTDCFFDSTKKNETFAHQFQIWNIMASNLNRLFVMICHII